MGHEIEREVERADGPDHAQRKMPDQSPSLLGLSTQVERDDLSFDSFGFFRGNFESIDSSFDFYPRGFDGFP